MWILLKDVAFVLTYEQLKYKFDKLCVVRNVSNMVGQDWGQIVGELTGNELILLAYQRHE